MAFRDFTFLFPYENTTTPPTPRSTTWTALWLCRGTNLNYKFQGWWVGVGICPASVSKNGCMILFNPRSQLALTTHPERQTSITQFQRRMNLKTWQALVTRPWARQSDRWSFLTQEMNSLSLSFFFSVIGLTVAFFVNSFEVPPVILLSMPVQMHCGLFQGLEPFRVNSHHISLLPRPFFHQRHQTLLGNQLIVCASTPTTR